jgi:hypothetical protein
MKKIVLITGANGMLAKHLAKTLEKDYSIRYLTRNESEKNKFKWDIKKKYIDPRALKDVDTIIHLAGASIATKRWRKKRKKEIAASRIDSAYLILKELNKQNIVINKFICASAIGFYGAKNSELIYDEETPNGTDFLSTVCHNWEVAAKAFKVSKVAKEIAIVRIGIILDKNEGALQKIALPIKYGVGSGIGSGKQFMPWIHIKDLSNLFKFLVYKQNVTGVFNAVAPDHITNIALTKLIAKHLNRPVFLPNIPKIVMQTLFGEMSAILLYGARISAQKITDEGFQFEFENTESAIKDLI